MQNQEKFVIQTESIKFNISKFESDSKLNTVGDSMKLHVYNVDNHAIIKLNGIKIYDRFQHYDPTFHDIVDLSHRINAGENKLVVTLNNARGKGYNPWHIKYKITLNNDVVVDVDRRSPSTSVPGLAYKYTHIIIG